MPALNDRLIRVDNASDISFFSLSIITVMLLGPIALFKLKVLITSANSSAVVGDKIIFLYFRFMWTASSIAFIEQSLFYRVVPTFSKVKRQFSNERDRCKCSEIILKSQAHKHKKRLS